MSDTRQLSILLLSPSMPLVTSWGFGIRVFQLAAKLAAHHRVSVLTYGLPGNAGDIAALRQVGADVTVVAPPARLRTHRRVSQLASLASTRPYQYIELHTPQMQRSLDRLLGSKAFDIVQVESSQMSGFDFGGHPRVVIDEHNIEYEVLYRSYRTEPSLARKLFNAAEYLKVRRLEQGAWVRADACLLTSQREEAVVKQVAPKTPTAVIPNGVDLDYFTPSGAAPSRDSLVFTGMLTYRPNLDAVRYFTREILPTIVSARPSTKLTVVGYGPPEMLASITGPNVVTTSWVPDVRPYIRAAAAIVVPMRIGGGTRLKVLDSLAAGKPVVSTSLGCEGIDVKDGEHVLIADEPRAFADQVLSVLDDPHQLVDLGLRGRRRVEEKYSWSAIGEKLMSFYGDLVEGSAWPLPTPESLPA